MIMSGEMLLSMFIYVSGVVILLLQWKHILNILLSFEIMMLGIITFFMLSWGLGSGDWSLMMVIVVFGVCEASLGLSLLVSMVRIHGNDYVNSLSLYKL
uniref:NADH-ubiquinone oxidoreductase chain 4L n=1 Tax=Heteroteuthis hawaiiensis TaxID=61676 RepID=A0A8F5CED3_9MOLL|nr:NADH dehydrogenase subunit 4L [Heteroteuthis hawaiiensis]QXJ42097.1 NADH dehydrogenase subunit 4L [Heteroteuthis hawaiiensis]